MTPERARLARANLEDVFTEDGTAVTVARVSVSTMAAWVEGGVGSGYGTGRWVALGTLTTREELMGQATIELDVCTPEGKTWLALVTGTHPTMGFARTFVTPVKRDVSGSGKTGVYTYQVGDGLYEANEGRKRLGKTYYRVTDGDPTSLTFAEFAEAVAAL